MLKRTLTAVVALAVFIPILLFAPYWAVAAVFALLAAVAISEIAGCVGLRREWWLTVVTMALCAAYIVIPNVCNAWIFWTSYEGSLLYEGSLTTAATVSAVRTFAPMLCEGLLILAYLAAAVLRHKKLPADRLMLQFGMTVYVALGFDALCRLARLLVLDGADGLTSTRVWLWVALCIPWVADTLAYFTGYFLGKHKLCPDISPKKTVEGAVGGVVGTGVVALIAFVCVKGWSSPLALVGVPLTAMLLAVVSIFGDLFASVLKRQFGVKDYGFIFPGHGGIMDRFDSTVPVAIVLALLLNVTPLSGLL